MEDYFVIRSPTGGETLVNGGKNGGVLKFSGTLNPIQGRNISLEPHPKII
jgi:hypothetical protein